MNFDSLKKFLLKNNRAGYVTGNEKSWKKEKDGSTTITYSSGDFKAHDNFFGGEPYGGRLVVFYKNKPFWVMVYYGWVKQGIDPEKIYPFLRKALSLMPENFPYRGPKNFEEKNFEYKNSWQGKLDKYQGKEKIYINNKEVYRANYMGGLVDMRKAL